MQLLLSHINIIESVTCISESREISEISSLPIMMETSQLSSSSNSEFEDPFEFEKHANIEMYIIPFNTNLETPEVTLCNGPFYRCHAISTFLIIYQ